MKQWAGAAEHHVDPERLWARHMELATVGGLANGGVDRQALTPEEGRARAMVVAWARAIDLTPATDPVGNLFLRYAGQQPEARPLMAGSHLDTQPIGGRFDGVYGVLAVLEAMTALRGMGWEPERPIDLVMWTNEEGCRFAPTTMGSSAFAGALSLDDVLATRDDAGVSVAEALDGVAKILGPIPSRPLGFPVHAFLEIHIEQGPMLEAHGCPVGVVTGVQGLRWFDIDVRGQAGHAGTTPENHRRDALVTALRILGALREFMFGSADRQDVRFTVGRFEVLPGAPNTIPGRVRFTIDLRHPDADRLRDLGDAIEGICERLAEPCAVLVEAGQVSPPIHFDNAMIRLLDEAAQAENIQPLHMMSGATHDAKWLSTVAPTGMLFVPCGGGISHNEAETADLEDLVVGTRVMCRALRELSAA